MSVKGLKNLSAHASNRIVKKGWYSFIILFFLIFVILPTVFVLSYVFSDWNVIQTEVLSGRYSAEFHWENTPVNGSRDIGYYHVYASPEPDLNRLGSEPLLNITSSDEHSSILTDINDTVYICVVSYNGTSYSMSNIARPV